MTAMKAPVAIVQFENKTVPNRQGVAAVGPRTAPDISRASASLTLVTALDLKEAAALLNIHPKTLRKMAKANKIPGARRIGKLWRFSAQRLQEWLDAS